MSSAEIPCWSSNIASGIVPARTEGSTAAFISGAATLIASAASGARGVGGAGDTAAVTLSIFSVWLTFLLGDLFDLFPIVLPVGLSPAGVATDGYPPMDGASTAVAGSEAGGGFIAPGAGVPSVASGAVEGGAGVDDVAGGSTTVVGVLDSALQLSRGTADMFHGWVIRKGDRCGWGDCVR